MFNFDMFYGLKNLLNIEPFFAIKESLKNNYNLKSLQSDIIAGIIVALIAMPLGMSLSIAVGLPPQFGLYTVIIAGFIVSLLGGSRFQVSGPTAAFVAILLPIVQDKGYAGLALCGLISGIILMIMGLLGFGKFIQYIPYPVTMGFTCGIGIVIFAIQIKDFLGLNISHLPINFIERLHTYYINAHTISINEAITGCATLIGIILWRKMKFKFPAPVVIISIVTMAVYFLNKSSLNTDISTIASTFTSSINGINIHGIPHVLPHANLKNLIFQSNLTDYFSSTDKFKELIMPSFTIALLAVIETLLSAVVADGMTNTKHESNSEIFALGVGNIFCAIFCGIPATGAIARTATNIKFGAKSPIAGMVHSIFTLLSVIFFAKYISYIPMASLAALLMIVSVDMIHIKALIRLLKVGSNSDKLVLFTCLSLTVVFDMVIGVSIGLIIACLLFIRRMSEVTTGTVLEIHEINALNEKIPDDVLVYKINGPLFFGAADNAIQLVQNYVKNVNYVLFIMDTVPSMDISGFIVLKSTIENLQSLNKKVGFVGTQSQPLSFFEKAGLINSNSAIKNYRTLYGALSQIKSNDLDSEFINI